VKKLARKIKKLSKLLLDYRRVLIAFSGGLDSTYLTIMAARILGRKNVLAVIARSPTYPKSEFRLARKILQSYRIPYRLIYSREIDNKKFCANTYRRCFYCKDELLKKISAIARKNKMVVCLGVNFSDLSDFRPGHQAIKKWQAKIPLAESRMTKEDIRQHSRLWQLPTADKPPQACLASRIPFYQPISREKLRRIEIAEDFLRQLGFCQIRVRDHDTIARIEIDPKEFRKIISQNIREKICRKLARHWKHITLDLAGYQPGVFNPQ